MAGQIEVFQDLQIECARENLSKLRTSLLAAAIGPWVPDLKRSSDAARYLIDKKDVLLFLREASQSYPAAGLTLFENETGYYVPNIVPVGNGSLTFTQYNALLMDFVERVARPVTNQIGASIIVTQPREALDHWLPRDAVEKLRLFSVAANKSTGSSHPSDKKRWFNFLVAAHRSKTTLDASTLARWLHEVDGWDEDSAHELAGDFESSLELMAFYDEH